LTPTRQSSSWSSWTLLQENSRPQAMLPPAEFRRHPLVTGANAGCSERSPKTRSGPTHGPDGIRQIGRRIDPESPAPGRPVRACIVDSDARSGHDAPRRKANAAVLEPHDRGLCRIDVIEPPVDSKIGSDSAWPRYQPWLCVIGGENTADQHALRRSCSGRAEIQQPMNPVDQIDVGSAAVAV